MKKYQIQIKETLAMTVTVEAENVAHACELVEEGWNNGEYVLDAEHFQGANFSVKSRSERER